jgi:hypothetical protein
VLETEVHKRQAPLFTYLKSRGFYAGVQFDGTIIIERSDENEIFYGERIGVKDILAGKVRHPPYEIKKLMETVKAAQGDTDVDETLLPNEPPPGDYEIEKADDKFFGVPAKEDPDPFGVLALEDAGLEIREAGTLKRPASEQFEFHPSPTSPIYNTFRKSTDRSSYPSTVNSRRSSWRTSTMSSILEPKAPTMVSMSTQTDFDQPAPIQVPPPLPPRNHRTPSPVTPVLADIPETKPVEDLPLPSEEDDAEKQPRATSITRVSKELDDLDLDSDEDEDEDEEEDEEEEEPIIAEIQQATAPQSINRARIVQVAKPVAPKLPARNPFRPRKSVDLDTATTRDASSGQSPKIGQSPTSTPELKADGSSASSISSVEGLEHVSQALEAKPSNDLTPQKEAKEDAFHSLPDSPVKAVPGSFN